MIKKIVIRWMDGYLETCVCNDIRFSSHYIWLDLTKNENRWIPICNIRTFSLNPDSKITK